MQSDEDARSWEREESQETRGPSAENRISLFNRRKKTPNRRRGERERGDRNEEEEGKEMRKWKGDGDVGGPEGLGNIRGEKVQQGMLSV